MKSLLIAIGFVVSLSAMQNSSHSAEKAFEDYVMNRQKWKEATCALYRNNPNDSDVQMLQRYISVIKAGIEDANKRWFKTDKSLLEMASWYILAFETSSEDHIFIETGKSFKGDSVKVIYPENYWTKGKLREIEQRIALKK